MFHIVDRRIRYAAGKEIPNKFKETLLEAYVETWTPPGKVLDCDGEGTLAWLKPLMQALAHELPGAQK